MPTPQEIQAQIDEINAAIATPERQVTLGSQNVTYRSIDDLIKARDALQGQLDVVNQVPRRPRRTYASYGGRGFD